jgi:hypothetical protein
VILVSRNARNQVSRKLVVHHSGVNVNVSKHPRNGVFFCWWTAKERNDKVRAVFDLNLCLKM